MSYLCFHIVATRITSTCFTNRITAPPLATTVNNGTNDKVAALLYSNRSSQSKTIKGVDGFHFPSSYLCGLQLHGLSV